MEETYEYGFHRMEDHVRISAEVYPGVIFCSIHNGTSDSLRIWGLFIDAPGEIALVHTYHGILLKSGEMRVLPLFYKYGRCKHGSDRARLVFQYKQGGKIFVGTQEIRLLAGGVDDWVSPRIVRRYTEVFPHQDVQLPHKDVFPVKIIAYLETHGKYEYHTIPGSPHEFLCIHPFHLINFRAKEIRIWSESNTENILSLLEACIHCTPIKSRDNIMFRLGQEYLGVKESLKLADEPGGDECLQLEFYSFVETLQELKIKIPQSIICYSLLPYQKIKKEKVREYLEILKQILLEG